MVGKLFKVYLYDGSSRVVFIAKKFEDGSSNRIMYRADLPDGDHFLLEYWTERGEWTADAMSDEKNGQHTQHRQGVYVVSVGDLVTPPLDDFPDT